MYLISLDDGSLRAMRTINQKVISYSFVACEWRAASARTANIHQSIHQTKRDLLWLLDKKTPHLVQINSFLNRSVQIICWELKCIFKSQSISQIFCKYPAAVTSEPPSEASDASCGSWNETKCHFWSSYAKCVCKCVIYTSSRRVSGCPAPECSSVFTS